MNLKNKKLIVSIIIILSVSLICLFYNNLTIIQSYNQVLLKRDSLILQNHLLKDLFFNNIKYKKKKVLPQVLPVNVNINNLVFKFTLSGCSPCIDNEAVNIKKISDKIGKNNILIISDFKSAREFKAWLYANELFGFRYLNMSNGSHLFPIYDSDKRPYYFILDGNGYAKSFFKPIINYPSLTNDYLTLVTRQYFSNNKKSGVKN